MNRACLRIITLSLIVQTALLLSQCSRTSSQDLLDGTFVLANNKAVVLLSPANGANVTQNPSLSWTTISPALKYRVQVSMTADFSNIVLDKIVSSTSYTVSNSDLTGVTELSASTHYWRVSLATSVLTSNVYSMEIMNTAKVYVNVNSTSNITLGNKTYPFKAISTAIGYADGVRSSNANVAAEILIAAGAYNEKINMLPGISIKGGYSATDWSRNISTNVTTINGPGPQAIVCGSTITSAYTSITIIDGFTVNGTTLGVFPDISGIYLNTSSPTIQNNIITGGANATTQNASGVSITNGSAPIILNNTINSGGISGTNYAAAIFLDSGSNGTISGNTLNGGLGSEADGIRNKSSSPIITNNTIIGSTGANSNAFGIYVESSYLPYSNLVIKNNSITSGITNNGAIGVYIYDANSTATIANNNISGGSGPNPTGVVISSINTTYLTGNTIQGGKVTAGAAVTGVSLNGTPAVITNNNIYGGTANSNAAFGINIASTAGVGSTLTIANNTINGGAAGNGCGGCNSVGIQIGSITVGANVNINNNNIFTTTGLGRYGIQENAAAADPTSVANNNIHDAPTALYRDNDTATSMTTTCGTGNYGNAGCVTTLATPTGSGNLSIDNTNSQLYQNIWKISDKTTGAGTTTTVVVASCPSYINGEYFEYNVDGVARQISGCAAGTVTFTPAMSVASVTNKAVTLWGTSASVVPNYQLQPASAAICNVIFGGLNLSSIFTTDYSNTTRTASTSGLPCTLTAPSTTTGAGWSIGAYERDN